MYDNVRLSWSCHSFMQRNHHPVPQNAGASRERNRPNNCETFDANPAGPEACNSDEPCRGSGVSFASSSGETFEDERRDTAPLTERPADDRRDSRLERDPRAAVDEYRD
eukprot:2687485-Prymnesium_polylepis.1